MIKIITDDGGDLPVRTQKKYDIDILPIAIIQDENEFFIGKNIEVKDMFDKMRAGEVFRTSQVTRMDMYESFEKYVKEGREVLYITLSSGLSGTYENALGAKEDLLGKYPDAKIYIVDSKSATAGQACVVVRAAMMARDGYSIDEILKETEHNIENQMHMFTVGDLEFLYRGGRLSKTSAMLGGLLNIMPILCVEREHGTLKPIDKVRGQKAFLKKLKQKMNYFSKDKQFFKDQTVVIAKGQWDEMTAMTKEFLINEMGINEANIEIVDIGCVVSAHTGPEVITVFFTSDNTKYNILEF